MKNFWQTLKKPFFVLAPMADVTDTAFREIIATYSRHGEKGGGPDVFYTEFVSADGLLSPGREVLLHDFEYTEAEHPIVAQIFGSNPDNIKKVSRMVRELGFDGVDINMGCPDRSVEKQGAGAALIKTPELAQELIYAAKEGAEDIPVSVKTRIGYNKNEIDLWLPKLLKTNPAAVILHARTRKEMSKVPARWEVVAGAVESAGALSPNTCIVGNGDIQDLADAKRRAEETGADGIMLGRAIFGNPWLFDENKHKVTTEEKLRVLVEHTKLFEKKLGDVKNFAIMKKHYKAYVTGFDGAKELRMRLMEAEDADEVEKIVEEHLD